MDDDLDRALEVDILASTLKAQEREGGDLMELLARMLQSALPGRTRVSRRGWLLSARKPIEELSVVFDECGYVIACDKLGGFSARRQKIVRAVALKSDEIAIDDCIDEIVAELSKLAEKNSQARQALNRFISGS